MDSSIIGLIVIAAVGVALLVAAVAWMMLTEPVQDRRDPYTIREDARGKAPAVPKPDMLAGQIHANGHHAARADADAARMVRLPWHLDEQADNVLDSDST